MDVLCAKPLVPKDIHVVDDGSAHAEKALGLVQPILEPVVFTNIAEFPSLGQPLELQSGRPLAGH